jgi:hypothetical protein
MENVLGQFESRFKKTLSKNISEKNCDKNLGHFEIYLW